MGVNCGPILVDLFLYSFEADFMQGGARKEIYLARLFIFTFKYIEDVLSTNNYKFW